MQCPVGHFSLWHRPAVKQNSRCLPCSFGCAESKVFHALQVALFDRIHNIRVKHIQEEYQKYMERVRSKAQSAIDQANANYQHHRAMLTARVDAMVHYLQQQYLRVGLPPPPLALPTHLASLTSHTLDSHTLSTLTSHISCTFKCHTPHTLTSYTLTSHTSPCLCGSGQWSVSKTG